MKTNKYLGTRAARWAIPMALAGALAMPGKAGGQTTGDVEITMRGLNSYSNCIGNLIVDKGCLLEYTTRFSTNRLVSGNYSPEDPKAVSTFTIHALNGTTNIVSTNGIWFWPSLAWTGNFEDIGWGAKEKDSSHTMYGGVAFPLGTMGNKATWLSGLKALVNYKITPEYGGSFTGPVGTDGYALTVEEGITEFSIKAPCMETKPQIKIQPSNDGTETLTVSWPTNYQENCALWKRGAWGEQWCEVTNAPTVIDGRFQLKVPKAQGMQFFQLGPRNTVQPAGLEF